MSLLLLFGNSGPVIPIVVVRVGSATLTAAPRITGSLTAAPRLTVTLQAAPRITAELTKG